PSRYSVTGVESSGAGNVMISAKASLPRSRRSISGAVMWGSFFWLGSPQGDAGIDLELQPGHVPGFIGNQKQHGVADVDRLGHHDRQRIAEDRCKVGSLIVQQRVQRIGAHAGCDTGRVHGVDSNTYRGKLI